MTKSGRAAWLPILLRLATFFLGFIGYSAGLATYASKGHHWSLAIGILGLMMMVIISAIWFRNCRGRDSEELPSHAARERS